MRLSPTAALVVGVGVLLSLGLGGAPPPRYLTGVAFDRARGVLVVFGGGDPSSNALRNDTWELDATGWRRVDPR
jgi:hypothetical protein